MRESINIFANHPRSPDMKARFFLVGYRIDKNAPNGKTYELIGHRIDWLKALSVAAISIGPRRLKKFDGVEIFDAFAKIGHTCLWDIDISGRPVSLETRPYIKLVPEVAHG